MSTTTLKLIALALMLLDHIYEFFPGAPIVLTWLGRISAPIFFFCTAWGFYYTHNRRVYLLRMYLCSVLMGALDLALNLSIAQPVVPVINNIFTTLFLSCLFIYLWEWKDKLWQKLLMVLAYLAINAAMLFLIIGVASPLLYKVLPQKTYQYCITMVGGILPNILTCEGSYITVLMGLVLYFCRESRVKLALGYGLYCLGSLALMVNMGFMQGVTDWYDFLFHRAYQWMEIFALPLMLCYNGQKGRGYKYLFYIFYPAHVAVLFYLGNLLA